MRASLCLLVALSLACVVSAAPAQRPATAAITVDLASRAMQPGELVVATIHTMSAVDRVTVRAFGAVAPSARVDPMTWQALVGIDLDTKPGTYAISIDAGAAPGSHIARTIVVKPKQFVTRQLRVDEAFVNPPPAALAEISDDTRALAAIWTSSEATRLWTGPFVRPVPQAANSAFGSRSVFNGQPRAPHSGADFLSPAGTPVAAPNAGRVALASNLYYTGNTIVLDHGLGLFSLFAHLSRMDVTVGDMVETGQIVGKVGATGRVTGPHLHWMVRAGTARVDPLSVLAMLGKP